METVTVKSVAPYRPATHEDHLVYNITVAEHHNYVVHGVLVGNTETLKDAAAVRGQKNEQLWLQFLSGHAPANPQVPFAHEKFLGLLKGAGINAVADGPRLHLKALTDADVAALSGGRELANGETVRFDKDLKPVPGGLFDPKLTGGHAGRLWSSIRLPEPYPSPVMEEPIRRVLGLTQKQFESTLAGEHALGELGTGPKAIARALDRLDLDREITRAKAEFHSARGATRDAAVRRWGYLKDAKRLGLHPRDWTLAQIPVLPPAFRPVAVLGDSGVPLVADANYLYREAVEAVKNHEAMVGKVGTANTGPERLALYRAFKAVTGLGDPVHPKLVEKNVKGLLKSVLGSSPKFSFLQRKLLSSTVDNVGRAVVAPEPDYDMDAIGIPENQAFAVYQRFIARRLKRRGLPLREALRHVKDRTPLARDALVEEMGERPVYVNRAPVLHRFGIMAFRPRLVRGDVVRVSPLVVKGFGMDFDGDAVQFHVPTTDEAVREAYDRMLPSRNLISPADFATPVHAPGQSYVAGLYAATRAAAGAVAARPHTFRDRAAVRAAWERGDVAADAPVEVLDD